MWTPVREARVVGPVFVVSLGVLLGACTDDPPKSAGTDTTAGTTSPDTTDPTTDPTTDNTDDPEDTADEPAPLTPEAYCAAEGLTVRPWRTDSGDTTFDAIAPDASFPLLGGDTWSLSEHWTGCDSVLLLSIRQYSSIGHYPDLSSVSAIQDWLTATPVNVQIVFFSDAAAAGDRVAELEAVQESVDSALTAIGGSTEAQLRQRIFFSDQRDTEADVIGPMATFVSDAGAPFAGISIDRMQVVRELGYLCDPLTGWSTCPAYFLAYEPEYHNFASDRQDRLDAQTNVDVYPLFVSARVEDPGWGGQRSYAVLELPDAATMASYDTMEFDLTMACSAHPDLVGCPAWDYLVHLYLCETDDPLTSEDESTICNTEVGRWITTYWRPGRWVHDVTPFLALLQDGGPRKFAFYSQQPYDITLDVRLSNSGHGVRPTELQPLFGGGYLSDTYNWGAIHQFDSSTGVWSIKVHPDDENYETTVVSSDIQETGGWLVGQNPRQHPYGRNDFTRMDFRWTEHGLLWCETVNDAASAADAEATPAANDEDLLTGCKGGAWRMLSPAAPGTELGSLDGNWEEIWTPAHLPQTVSVPADVAQVELMAVITGHGGAGDGCAEFCDHQHTFTFDDGSAELRDHPMVGDLYGCAAQVADGTIPNQAGTWIYGRGGWCPGLEVDPWRVDVSDRLLDGDPHEIGYFAEVDGEVRRRNGHEGARIDMVSYLVYYR